MSSFGDFLRDMGIVNEEEKGKVIKSYPTTETEQKLDVEMQDIAKHVDAILDIQIKPLIKKYNSKRELFWGTVKERLQEYSDHLHYNENTKEVEVIQDDD